jgi:hypothetical protein
MTVCAKILLTVQGAEQQSAPASGAVDNDTSGAGSQSTVFTVCLDKTGWNATPLGLASAVIASIASEKHCASEDCAVVRRVSIMLRAAARSTSRREDSELGDYVLPEGSALRVRCPVAVLSTEGGVVHGTAVCCVQETDINTGCVQAKQMHTGVPVVHAYTTLAGRGCVVTVLLRTHRGQGGGKGGGQGGGQGGGKGGGSAASLMHCHSVAHFISSGDTECVNLRQLGLGRRPTSCLLLPPLLSHFKRRQDVASMHRTSFTNAGLPQLTQAKHSVTPLFVVQSSQTLGEHAGVSCFSVVI